MTKRHPRTADTDRSAIFNSFFPELENKSVLDFGGNRGNLLHFQPNINQSKYTCVDIDQNLLDEGAEEFTTANWVYYNRWNMHYNPSGNQDESFPEVEKHDYVWSFSVFSHTALDDTIESIQWLVSKAKEKVVVSFLNFDTEFRQFFYNKRVSAFSSCEDIVNMDLTGINNFYLINNSNVITNEDSLSATEEDKMILSFIDSDVIINRLAEVGITATVTKSLVPFLVIDVS